MGICAKMPMREYMLLKMPTRNITCSCGYYVFNVGGPIVKGRIFIHFSAILFFIF